MKIYTDKQSALNTIPQSELETEKPTRTAIFQFLCDKTFIDAIRTGSALVVPTMAEVDAEYEIRLSEWLNINQNTGSKK